MKKLFTLCFAVFLTLTCFTACNMLDGVFSKKSGVNKKYYENSAVFTFDGFESKISITLDRTIPGEGAIYYQINIKKGALSVGYTDTGIGRKQQPLGEFTADEKMPINGSGGYIEGDKITITFKAISPVNGEIIIAFTEDALKVVHGNLQIHKHTYSYTSAGKVGHYTSFTCGCPSQEGTTPHYDENTDYICDFCKCDMTEFADEWKHDETHHWYISDDEAVYCYGEHQNFDADLYCDICGFNMSEIPQNDDIIGSVDVYGGNKSISLSFATRDDYTYIVYYKLKNAHDIDYVELENEFMIADGNTFNCYISGIPAGTYNVKIVATSTIKDESFWITLTNVEVLPQE